ncbi:acyl-CoA desaturase [Siphonobacter aquaeclarae]|uniref:Stearoyl-CoA desaturase (Delta-9 desaturase) n=1 Tax=Siphonobacter aquaeclarae TaxID=563176 RepID=A0A1G9TZB4_9BACT|nr:acyl-CoA desaturase [Siphonobacter aquaeclarae]SDM53089.1 stearoyl-CoA desaturase (delta-9 desaturase) [Siphonobacter aquaeclarae]
MYILLFFVAHWYLSLFSQTFFLHRYAAHQMFTMSKGWERFFYVFTWITQGSSFLSPYAYGVMHRLHHAYADTENDPHSPSFSENLFDMMWKTKNRYNAILHHPDIVEPKFRKNVPNWPLMERIGDNWLSRVGWGTLYTLYYIHFATSGWEYLLLPVHYLMGPVHGVVINWFAHKYGYTNFKVNDTAKNLLPFDFLMMGESYHNNHHKLGGRANFGVKWWEFDPTYPVILVLNAVGVVKLKKNNDLNYM